MTGGDNKGNIYVAAELARSQGKADQAHSNLSSKDIRRRQSAALGVGAHATNQ
jgi:hypothetical protein